MIVGYMHTLQNHIHYISYRVALSMQSLGATSCS